MIGGRDERFCRVVEHCRLNGLVSKVCRRRRRSRDTRGTSRLAGEEIARRIMSWGGWSRAFVGGGVLAFGRGGGEIRMAAHYLARGEELFLDATGHGDSKGSRGGQFDSEGQYLKPVKEWRPWWIGWFWRRQY